ncbi:hypothetical protein ERO13_D08G112024v2 [Gossypium hirsutum]|uniref:Uncharacterized protein n=1 Tax=Gossypium tomentosum TaxID=34277 RepID=A0A5D2JU12_GOSTO|nr:hypothetical protein ERO13_D08G112024v2 [Gossypium hirsutum]TYH57952.1 hypothetical protein ES332_D08G122900v1 [Gossypium tomentosum]
MGEPVKSGRNCFLIFNLASICESLTSGPSHATNITREGAHGFMRTHKWRDSIGAFINVEASGTRRNYLFMYDLINLVIFVSFLQTKALDVGRELIIAEKTNYLVFMINAFQMGVGEYDQRENIRYGDSQPSSGFLGTQQFAQPNMTRTSKPTC